MKWTKLLAFSLILLQFSCENTTQPKGYTPQYLAENTKPTLKIYSELELTNLWDSLCNIHDCLTGGQRVYQGRWGGEGCVLTLDKQWINFLNKTDKKQLSSFLIKQLSDKAESQIHTCPYDDATKGELALYCLQGISKINFYELAPSIALEEKEVAKKYHNHQAWIWHIQSSKKELEDLQKLWTQHFEKL